jgi:hypothetical protein
MKHLLIATIAVSTATATFAQQIPFDVLAVLKSEDEYWNKRGYYRDPYSYTYQRVQPVGADRAARAVRQQQETRREDEALASLGESIAKECIAKQGSAVNAWRQNSLMQLEMRCTVQAQEFTYKFGGDPSAVKQRLATIVAANIILAAQQESTHKGEK